MPAPVVLRNGFTTASLAGWRQGRGRAGQSRRLLSLAAVLNGMSREEAARIGGMDRQTPRDWMHRFNAHWP